MNYNFKLWKGICIMNINFEYYKIFWFVIIAHKIPPLFFYYFIIDKKSCQVKIELKKQLKK
jgi:hypothetical protein